MKRAAREMVAMRWILSTDTLHGNARLVLVALVVHAGVPPGFRTMPELAADTALSQGDVCLALGELVGASLVEHVGGEEYRAAWTVTHRGEGAVAIAAPERHGHGVRCPDCKVMLSGGGSRCGFCGWTRDDSDPGRGSGRSAEEIAGAVARRSRDGVSEERPKARSR